MKPKTKKRYSEDFKRDTVQLMENSDKPVAQISREMGVNASIIRAAIRSYLAHPTVTLYSTA